MSIVERDTKLDSVPIVEMKIAPPQNEPLEETDAFEEQKAIKMKE